MSTARMNWQQLLSSLRELNLSPEAAASINTDENDARQGRTAFHKDHDRIVFSSSFRRLDRKTQVHPLSENDHVHSRLTHSLEVSCVGRSLALEVAEGLKDKLPQGYDRGDLGAIVQAACLAHDIGNPPYGHTGEDAIRHWFRDPANKALMQGLSELEKLDLQTFEGNAQGLRIVTQVESHRFNGGMRLTHATLGSFLKYPWTVEHAAVEGAKLGKFGCYQSELPILKQVANTLGLIPVADNKWCRHPLVYLVEAADDICYGIVDLEDAIEMGILHYQEVEDLLRPLFANSWPKHLAELEQADNERRRLSLLRSKAMKVLVAEVSRIFIVNEEKLLAGSFSADLISHCHPDVRDVVQGAKQLAKQKIFKDPRKLAIEIGAYSTLAALLSIFLTAANEVVNNKDKPQAQLSYKTSRVMELLGGSAPQADWSLYQAYMRVMDFVAGMTDNYAADIAQQFSGYHPHG